MGYIKNLVFHFRQVQKMTSSAMNDAQKALMVRFAQEIPLCFPHYK